MGVIHSSKIDIHGVRTETEVRTNRFEDFLINLIGRVIGEGTEWRLVHWVEKRKLKK